MTGWLRNRNVACCPKSGFLPLMAISGFIALLLPLAVHGQSTLTDLSNLVAYYNFDAAGSGGLTNYAPGATAYNATRYGGGSFNSSANPSGPGFAGNASFDGGDGLSDRGTLLAGNALNLVDRLNDAIVVPLGTGQIGSTFTISVWHALTPGVANASTRYHVFEASDAGNYDVSWGTANSAAGPLASYEYLAYLASGSSTVSATSVATNAWHHVVHVFTVSGANTTVTVYLDGVPKGSLTAATASIDFTGLHFGRARTGTADDRDWDGMFDELSVWSRALSAAEVTTLHNQGLAALPLVNVLAAENWPTFKHDNQRTGVAPGPVALPLYTQWVYIARHAPAPAWPPPANQNYTYLGTIVPIVTSNAYDRAFQLAASNNRVYFGSNADGKVYCLDATTGQEKWTFSTEGPVRFAPTISGGNAYFGSDDGRVYCVNDSTGSLVWRYSYDSSARRMAGNEHIISCLPVRTDVMVLNNTCNFGTGLFPSTAGMGAWRIVLNAANGSVVSTKAAAYAPEGYLVYDGTTISCPTGQLGNQPFSKTAREFLPLSKFTYYEYDGSTITVGSTAFVGDSTKITGGTWFAPVNGRAHSVIFSNGRLFVSTDRGYIYCFASASKVADSIKPAVVDFPYANNTIRQQYIAAAQQIVSASGLTRGYCLVLNGNDGALAYELAKAAEFQIICVESDSAKVAASRQNLDAAGVGNRVTVHRVTSAVLPYSNFLFDIVAGDGYATGGTFTGSKDEAKRVLRPYGGMAFFAAGDTYRKGSIAGAGEWTHGYNTPQNNPCSSDPFVGGSANLKMQWFGKPGPRERLDRHHRTPAPVWKNGVMFVPGENWLTAVNAYNGTIYWDKAVQNSSRIPGFRDASHLAAANDYVYIASDNKCLGLTHREGTAAVTLTLPDVGTGTDFAWGYVALVDSIIFGSAEKNRIVRYPSARSYFDCFFDFKPWVVSEFLFALNRHTGAKKWHYIPVTGTIINSTVLINNGNILFMESTNAATRTTDSCHFPLSVLLGNGTSNLVALNAATGAQVYRRTVNLSKLQHSIYMICVNNRAIVTGAYNQGSNAAYDILGFGAADGTVLWPTVSVVTASGINGGHGDQDGHPVVVGDRLFISSYHAGVSVNIITGAGITWAFDRGGHGCGQISATSTHLYYRGGNPVACDIATNTVDRLNPITRSGCWINMVPAGGMLNIPEYSSGCTCAYSLQTSLSFLSTAAMPVDSQVTMSGRRNGSAVMPAPRLFLSRSTHVLSVHVSGLSPFENVRVRIVNAAGRVLFASTAAAGGAGTHTFNWNCRVLPAGIYLISLQTSHAAVTQKMLMCR